MERLFSDLPLWGVFVGTLFLVLAAVEAGYRLARQRQKVHELEKEAPVVAYTGTRPTADGQLLESVTAKQT